MHRNFPASSRRSNLTSNVVVSLNVPSPLGSLIVSPGNVRKIVKLMMKIHLRVPTANLGHIKKYKRVQNQRKSNEDHFSIKF